MTVQLLNVIASMDPVDGGLCQSLRSSIPALELLGCHNEVVCLDMPDAAFLAKDPFPIHAIGPASGPWAACPALIPWLREHLPRFDAAIIHGLWQQPAYAVTKVMRELRRQSLARHLPRVFLMPHGMLDPWFQRDPSRQLKAWRNSVYWHLIERHTIAEADGLLFTCQQELELARQTFWRYRPQAENNIGLGVAPPPTESPSMRSAFLKLCPPAAERPYLLFLSRIHPKKGVDLLINAYAQLAKLASDGRSLPLLVIAGPVDSSYAQSMMQLARSHGLFWEASVGPADTAKPGIVFTGMLQGDAKWGAFYGCEAFVLPSHQENFGIAVVEALACGKPVLISDQVNIYSDLTEDGAALVAADTLEGTYKLFKSWYDLDDHTREQFTTNSQRCYENRYLPESAARRMLEVLQVQR